MTDISQWTTVRGMITLNDWIGDELEQQRVGAYAFYESLYLNTSGALVLKQRGTNDNPIYVPCGRQITDTMHRFLAPGMTMIPLPAFGTDAERTAAALVLADLYKRERFMSRFSASKREGIYRGDWLFHLYADPSLPEGNRISIFPLDPATYFPIYNPDNVDEVIGCHIVEQFVDDAGNTRIRRLTYRKETGKAGPSPITVEEGVYKVDAWGGPGMDQEPVALKVLRQPEKLPEPIDHLPVYHIRNTEQTGTIWGRSELQGLERLIAGIDQAISDEELSLALEGLGVYWTDSGAPVDEDGNRVPWNLGPARVVEVQTGTKMNRVSGVTSVAPYGEHLSYLHSQIDGVAATPPIAKGNVEVSVAESGISLQLQMGPLLFKAEEKEIGITDTMVQMHFDLGKWFAAYEPSSLAGPMQAVRFMPVYGDHLPTNKSTRLKEILDLYGAKLVSMQWVWTELAKLGYDVGDHTEMLADILEETETKARIEQDAFGARIDQDLEDAAGGAGA